MGDNLTTYINTGSVRGTAIALPTIATVTVALRAISRAHSKQGFGWDDAASFFALLFTWGLGACLIYGADTRTIGVHSLTRMLLPSSPEYDPDMLRRLVLQYKLDYAVFILFALAIGTIRLSALLLYQRLFKSRTFQIINWIVMGLVVVWTVAFFIANVAICKGQVSLYWQFFNPDRLDACYDSGLIQLAAAPSDVILDGFVLLLPILPVTKLQMPRARKILIIGIFLSGACATACAIVRTVYAFAFTQRRFYVLGLAEDDVMGLFANSEFWPMIEVGVACITVNLPAIPGAFKVDYIQQLRSWASGSSASLRRRSDKDAMEADKRTESV